MLRPGCLSVSYEFWSAPSRPGAGSSRLLRGEPDAAGPSLPIAGHVVSLDSGAAITAAISATPLSAISADEGAQALDEDASGRRQRAIAGQDQPGRPIRRGIGSGTTFKVPRSRSPTIISRGMTEMRSVACSISRMKP